MTRFLFWLYILSCLFSFILLSCNQKTVSSLRQSTFQADSTFFNGYWSGDLRFDDYHLPIGFDISDKKILFDNPAQGNTSFPVDSSFLHANSLKIHLGNLTFNLTAFANDSCKTIMRQMNDVRSFILIRDKKLSKPERPQHPKSTEEYISEEVAFRNGKADISLEGTLTLPEETPSAFVILLSGSGPQDRDETILSHRPFAFIADKLTRRGIGVLRYDDRGVGDSEGSHTFSTSFDFAEDADAAYQYLSHRYPESRIGFIGHSEGGMIAQIADSLVGGAAFHIYLAGPGLDIVDLMVEQNRHVLKGTLSAASIDIYAKGLKSLFELVYSDEELAIRQAELNEKAKALYNSLPPDEAQHIAPSDVMYAMSISQLMYLKWWPYFLEYKPSQYLSQISCPILALNGEKDIQVTPDNLIAIKKHAVQSEVTVLTLENTNHLFQKCHRCTLLEYGLLTETFSPHAMDTIINWLVAKHFIKS